MANIILLNGTSSSGKSTVGKLLQECLRDPEWLLLSIDDTLGNLPDHAFETKVKFSKNLLHIIPGFHRSIAAFAMEDVPVIVDHVFQEDGWFQDFIEATKGISVLLVGLKCPIDVIEAREKSRGDRETGLGRMQFPKVHQGIKYDLEIDTSRLSPAECVARIVERLNCS